MQINTTIQDASSVVKPVANQAAESTNKNQATATQPQAESESSVKISTQAMALSQQSQMHSTDTMTSAGTLPSAPVQGDVTEQYVDYRKAKAQYQIYSDMAGAMTGNNSGLSPVTAHYASNNDEAREALVNSKAQQQQLSTMQIYAETTQGLYTQA